MLAQLYPVSVTYSLIGQDEYHLAAEVDIVKGRRYKECRDDVRNDSRNQVRDTCYRTRAKYAPDGPSLNCGFHRPPEAPGTALLGSHGAPGGFHQSWKILDCDGPSGDFQVVPPLHPFGGRCRWISVERCGAV